MLAITRKPILAPNPAVALADREVRHNIRACLAGGVPAVDVARELGVCAATITELTP